VTALRVLVVDDEPPARRRLRALCAAAHEVELVGECADGPSAIARLRAGGIDLVLLDVSLPGQDGLGVVRSVGPEHMPEVVFVTARGDHAVAAFELEALDYLLKPFDRARFEAMLARVRARIEERRQVQEVGCLARQLETSGPPLAREPIALRCGARTLLADPLEIAWAEAADNYVRVHVGGRETLVRTTLREFAARLAPHGFLRIHRSLLVNPRVVRELCPRPGGEVELHLEDGTQLVSARGYRQAIAARWRPRPGS
jgi:two-component system LytT family response regulator